MRTYSLLEISKALEGEIVGFCDQNITAPEQLELATNTEISVGDLAQKIINQINPGAKIITDEIRLRPEKSEVFRLFGDNTKIKKNTDWQNHFSLDEGIKETIDWFRKKENLGQYKSDIYNV